MSRSLLLSSKVSQVTVTHQRPALLIPETEGERFQAGEQGDRLHALKQRLRFVTFLQVVVRSTSTCHPNPADPDHRTSRGGRHVPSANDYTARRSARR